MTTRTETVPVPVVINNPEIMAKVSCLEKRITWLIVLCLVSFFLDIGEAVVQLGNQSQLYRKTASLKESNERIAEQVCTQVAEQTVQSTIKEVKQEIKEVNQTNQVHSEQALKKLQEISQAAKQGKTK